MGRGLVREVYGLRGGVACEWLPAGLVGLGILESGGNAVDAAVAVSLALSVGIPHLGGVGGDFFALVRLPDGGFLYVNGSGHAPSRLTRELLAGMGYESVPGSGPLSIVVPGMIEGLYSMWRRLGSLEWGELVEPAARMAGEGFPVPRSLLEGIGKAWGELGRDPGSRETYGPLRGLRPGERVRFPGLSRLLSLVAEDPRAFYEGEPARAMEEYLSTRGGVLEAGDMRGYRAWLGEPLEAEYRGWIVREIPPNSQGITSLHILKILESMEPPRDPLERAALIARISPPAYRLRDRELGDPRFMRRSPAELLSPGVIEELRGEAERMLAGGGSCRGPSRGEAGDTTFYVVADADGMVVAGIQSLFYPFGSMVTEPRFQVTLNSRAQGFTLEPGLPNTLGPGKRPLHTLSALIAEDPEAQRILALGSSGGHFRPQQHALLLSSVVDAGMTPGEAVAAPRILWVPGTCTVTTDPGLEAGAEGLLGGYKVGAGRTGVAAALELDVERGVYTVATDHRGEGYPLAL